ncbi:lysophospholipid acyltransferase family protein [Parapedobacter sp. DT-150]|uniref:lysophospholipid acyltransferase family protein n=1 Tax=Parapedobacter sp. DT-150 TaxID=3396162 RepID=UPI003F198EA0
MKKILGYILSPVFYLLFGIVITVFHPIQWLCLKLGGYQAHKNAVDVLNCCLVACYYVLGNTVKFSNKQQLPTDRPILFVANHQSMYDIPPLIFFLRKHHGKFISKIELTKGIPSISFNLRHGGAANIDRKDPKQSIAEILKLANNMKTKNWSAFIFPEGTRAKTGKIKPFNVGGIATILKKVPNVLIVPVAINHSWEMVRYGFFPLNTLTRMSWEVLTPIEPQGLGTEEVVAQVEASIKEKIALN